MYSLIWKKFDIICQMFFLVKEWDYLLFRFFIRCIRNDALRENWGELEADTRSRSTVHSNIQLVILPFFIWLRATFRIVIFFIYAFLVKVKYYTTLPFFIEIILTGGNVDLEKLPFWVCHKGSRHVHKQF